MRSIRLVAPYVTTDESLFVFFFFLNVLPFKKCSCAVEFMALNSIVHNLIIGI